MECFADYLGVVSFHSSGYLSSILRRKKCVIGGFDIFVGTVSGGLLLVDLVVRLVIPANVWSLHSSGIEARLRWYVRLCVSSRLRLIFHFGRLVQLKYLYISFVFVVVSVVARMMLVPMFCFHRLTHCCLRYVGRRSLSSSVSS